MLPSQWIYLLFSLILVDHQTRAKNIFKNALANQETQTAINSNGSSGTFSYTVQSQQNEGPAKNSTLFGGNYWYSNGKNFVVEKLSSLKNIDEAIRKASENFSRSMKSFMNQFRSKDNSEENW